MTLICRVRGHRADENQIWNEGYFFSSCRRCGRNLIRTSGDWHRPPSGFQVTWKSGQHRHAIASDFRRNLPLLGGKPRRWRRSFYRPDLGAICLPGPPLAPRDGEAEEKSSADSGLPAFLLLAFVTMLGVATRLAPRPRTTGRRTA